MIAQSTRRSSTRRTLNLFLVLAMMVSVVAALPAPQAEAVDTNIVTIDVISARTEPKAFGGVGVVAGDPVAEYKYLLSVDDTASNTQRSADPGTGCNANDPGYPESCDWMSVAGIIGEAGWPSGSGPIYTQGDETDFGPGLPLPNGDYLISVLADGYELGGQHFTIPLEAPGLVTVKLQPGPIPTATIQAAVFEDISPVNGAPDLPAEHGLAGFEAHIFDYAGEITTDLFGNPIGAEYSTPDDPDTYIPGSGGVVRSKCYVVAGAANIGTVPHLGPDPDAGPCPTSTNLADHPGFPDGSVVQGKIVIPNIGPNRYGLSVVRPDGSNWVQTTTLEGLHEWDSWVMAGSTGLDTEFVVAGEPFPTAIFGYVSATNTLAGGTGSVTGVVDVAKVYVPPKGGTGLPGEIWSGAQGMKTDGPVVNPWIALSDLSQGDTAVYVGQGDANGFFDITGVPDGNYTLTWWDEPQVYILDLLQITVANGAVTDMGVLPSTGWWTELEGYVFLDSNRNGVMDAGEQGLSEYPITMRKRENSLMDRGGKAWTTDQNGYYKVENVYPTTQWLIMEAYNDLFYTTGVTYQADNQPTPTTILGAGVDINVLPIIMLGGRLDWGVHPYDASGTNGIDPRNGGIVGTVSYDTTRAELDPQYAGAEDWQPSIPGLPVNLYSTIFCGTNPGAPCSTGAGISYELAADGSYAKGPLLNSVITENWERPSSDCVARDVEGNPLVYPDDQQVFADDTLCLEAPMMGVQFGPNATDVGTSDENFGAAVDGNYGFGDGCFMPDGVTPGAFDVGTETCSTGELAPLPGGRDYLVEVEIPLDALGRPLYKFTREEDINVGNGDEFIIPAVPPPSCAGPLHTVDVQDFGTDGFPAVDVFGDGSVIVPASTPTENPTFAEIGDSIYEGLQRPLCDTKLVQLSNGRSIAPTFFVFTDVPLPARMWGLLVDDLNFTTDPTKTLLGEKAGIPFGPVGIYDWTNRLVVTMESDYNGFFDVLLPSTNRINCASPSGVCANMYRFVGNDPGSPGALNTNYKPAFRTIAADFEAYPGLLVPADLAPTQVGVSIQLPSGQIEQVSCELEPTTPQLYAVDQPYASAGSSFTVNGIGFGASGEITLDGTPLATTSWSDSQIVADLGATAPGPHQLMIAAANGQTTVNGLTFHVLGAGYSPDVWEAGPGRTFATIQAAVDAAEAAAGDDLVVVYPGIPTGQSNPRGAHYENLIITQPIKLQGVGPGSPDGSVPGSIIDGIAFGGDTPLFEAWLTKIAGLTWDGNQTIFDGAVVSIFAHDGVFTDTYKASIDGLDLRGGNQQGFPGNINQIGGLPTGLPAALSTQGGAVFANGYARHLQITNNTVQNNGGAYGTVRIGNPDLPAPGTDNQNENVRIAHNRIIANGGTNLAGAIGLFAGADGYEVAHNDICGNFSAEYGGGISHYGLSPNGEIHNNRIYYNASYDEGGGVMIAGALPADPTTLSTGSGPVDIHDNLIQGNLANDDGGGLRFLMAGNSPMNVYNNMIVNNVSTHEGGGVGLNDAPDVRVYNNTIMKNLTTATGITSTGARAPAGLSTSPNSSVLQATLPGGSPLFSDPLLFNNIFWDNRAGSYAGGDVTGLGIAGDPTPIDLWDLGVAFSASLLSPTNSVLQTTEGTIPDGSNTLADPLVVDEYDVSVAFNVWRNNPNFVGAVLVAVDAPPELLGDYHLQFASPAIGLGAASKSGINAPATDIDGDARPTGAGYDSGADEVVDQAPALTLDAPANGSQVAAPVTISGTATDDIGVTEVRIEIYDRVTTQWWNGTGWQGGRTYVTADLSGLPDWTYTFAPPSASTLPYWATARAYDTGGQRSTRPTTNFTIGDGVAPTVAFVAPANGATVAAPVTISGTADDNAAVTQVRLEIYNRDLGQWWNGTGWQGGRTYVTADLSGLPNWTYSFAPGSGATLPYWVTARAYDAAGNRSSRPTTNFSISADAVAPTVALVEPVNGSSWTGTVPMSGTAVDNVGVTEVRIEIYDRVTTLWWNGDAGAAEPYWQTARTHVLANLGPTGPGVVTDWAYIFTPPAGSALPYWSTLRAYDGLANRSTRPTTNFTVVTP